LCRSEVQHSYVHIDEQRTTDSEVEVPETAPKRGGIQPVVQLPANDRVRAQVAVGVPMTSTAVIETPAGGDKVVAADWD
jgi:hypothetical protein